MDGGGKLITVIDHDWFGACCKSLKLSVSSLLEDLDSGRGFGSGDRLALMSVGESFLLCCGSVVVMVNSARWTSGSLGRCRD